MDIFLSRLKSTVAEALPGIPLSQDYDIQELRASAGPGRLWKVHAGVQKSTKQAVSIFVFVKKSIEKLAKDDRKIVVEVLKQGVHQLTRLRHPKVLSVVRPLEENRECLCFATEPVLGSLSDVIYGRGGGGGGSSASVSAAADEGGSGGNGAAAGAPSSKMKLDDVEVKYGLLQILDGLSFLHNDAKIVHGGLSLSSIVINGNGMWKLGGFEFAINSSNGPGQPALFTCKPWTGSQCPFTQPDLDYTAPEWVLSSTCDAASDMFSLGVVIHALYNDGRAVLQCDGQLSVYKSKAPELKKIKASSLLSIPETMREFMNLLLNPDSNVRPDANQLAKVPYFESIPVATLQYIDSLVQRDNLQKSQFFKELPKALGQLPVRLCLLRVLPALFQECYNHDMIPFVLANAMAVIERTSNDEYTYHVFPNLVPLFKISKPIQVPMIFMQNMALLLSKTSTADVKNHVLPMVYRSLEMQTDNMQLQELCLSILPSFSNMIDQSAMKNAVIPRIKKLCFETGVLSVRVQCLVCLGKMLDHIDKWAVLDDILPFLPTVPSREAAVLMSILGIYKVAFAHSSLGISKEMLATKVLPFLIPVCIDSSLNLMQFKAYMAVIKEMLAKVETEHQSKLQQMHQMEQEQRSLNIGVPNGTCREDAMTDSFLTSVGLMMGPSSSTQQPSAAARSQAAMSGLQQTNATSTEANPVKKQAPLTLEDKQRLVREQELRERLSSEPQLAPVAAAMSNGGSRPPQQQQAAVRLQPPPQIKDLTQTLPTATSAAAALHAQQSRLASPALLPSSSSLLPSSAKALPAVLSNGTGPTWLGDAPVPAVSSGLLLLGTETPPAGGSRVPSTGAASWSQPVGVGGRPAIAQAPMQQPPPSSSALDLSAFDSLLTLPSSQRPKAPMQQQTATPYSAAPVGTPQPPRLLPPPSGAIYGKQPQIVPSTSGYGQLQSPSMAAGNSWSFLTPNAGGSASTLPSAPSVNKLNAQDLRDLLG